MRTGQRVAASVGETFLPGDPVARSLTVATAAFALANGVFYTVSALYFTRVVGLPATTVGLGLGVAGGAGVAASYLGGRLSDRVGAQRVMLWGTVLTGAAMLAYQAAADAVVFTAVACVAVGGRAAQGSSKSAMLAVWYTGADRVTVRARLRVVTNVSIGLGTVVAGAALLVDTAVAYRTAMAAVGALVILASVPVARLPRRVPALVARLTEHTRHDDARGRTSGPSPLRDGTYVASVGFNALVAM